MEKAEAEHAPATSNGSRSSTSDLPVEQTAPGLMDISSSSDEEGEITNNMQQEMTDETKASEIEQWDTDEQPTKGSIDSTTTPDDYNRSRQLSSLSFQEENPPDTSQHAPSVEYPVKSPSTKAQLPGSSQMLTRVGDVPKVPVDSPRQSLEAENPAPKPLEPEVFEDSSDLADSEIYEPPEPIATASTESRKPSTPPLSPVVANATAQFEGKEVPPPTTAQRTMSTSAEFQTIEMPGTVEPVKVRTRLLLTRAHVTDMLVGCKLSNATEDRTLCPLREPTEAI